MIRKKQHIIIFLVPLVALIIILALIPFKQALVFEYQNTKKILAYILMSEEKKFKIKYTHSIHLSDVVESYIVTKDGQIQQYELMYEDYAIGMPSNASEGEIFEQKDGKYYIKNMKLVFPFFNLRIGQVVANHTVIYKNGEYALSDYMEPGTSVRIKIAKLNFFQQLKGVNILEQ